MNYLKSGAKIIIHAVGSNDAGGVIAGSGNNVPSPAPITGGSRIIGRPPMTPTAPTTQGLYVVSSNTGTITVVTRTVAAGQGKMIFVIN